MSPRLLLAVAAAFAIAAPARVPADQADIDAWIRANIAPETVVEYEAFAAGLDEAERRSLVPLVGLIMADAHRANCEADEYAETRNILFAAGSGASVDTTVSALAALPADRLFLPSTRFALWSLQDARVRRDLALDPTELERAAERHFLRRAEESRAANDGFERGFLELAYRIARHQVTRAWSCDAYCRSVAYLDTISRASGESRVEIDGRRDLDDDMAGIDCPPCDGLAARENDRTPVRRYLTAWEEPWPRWTKEAFLAREAKLHGLYVLVSGTLPPEHRDLLSELVLMQIGEAPPKAIAKRVAALPVDVLADDELEKWLIGAVPLSGDLKWWRERNRLVEEVFVGKYLENPAEAALLDRAIALCQFSVEDPETGLDCEAAARMAHYIEEYEAAHGRYPVATRRHRAEEWQVQCGEPSTEAP